MVRTDRSFGYFHRPCVIRMPPPVALPASVGTGREGVCPVNVGQLAHQPADH